MDGWGLRGTVALSSRCLLPAPRHATSLICQTDSVQLLRRTFKSQSDPGVYQLAPVVPYQTVCNLVQSWETFTDRPHRDPPPTPPPPTTSTTVADGNKALQHPQKRGLNLKDASPPIAWAQRLFWSNQWETSLVHVHMGKRPLYSLFINSLVQNSFYLCSLTITCVSRLWVNPPEMRKAQL